MEKKMEHEMETGMIYGLYCSSTCLYAQFRKAGLRLHLSCQKQLLLRPDSLASHLSRSQLAPGQHQKIRLHQPAASRL